MRYRAVCHLFMRISLPDSKNIQMVSFRSSQLISTGYSDYLSIFVSNIHASTKAAPIIIETDELPNNMCSLFVKKNM